MRGKIRVPALAVLLFTVLSFPAHARNDAGEMEVLIPDLRPGDMEVLAGLELTLIYRSVDGAGALVDRHELDHLRMLGFDPVVLVEDVAAEQALLEAVGALKGYHNHDEMGAALEALAADYPTITHLETIGFSVRGREIWAMKVSDNAGMDEAEPEIVFDANIHGNERIGAEVTLYLLEELCAGYGVDPSITELVDTREIWVVPMMNPDGVASISRYNANGVDMNRDFGYMWDGWGDSPAPISQPESRALMELFWDHQFVFGTSCHSGTEYFSYPWSFHYDRAPDYEHFEHISNNYDLLADYSGGQGSHGMYYINGSSKDAGYGNGTLFWTLEISTLKTPASSRISHYCERNREAMLYLIADCGSGITGTVTDASNGRPLRALVDVATIGWPVYTDPVLGDFHRYCLPGTYTLVITAAGYDVATIEGIVVTDGEATTLDVQLTPLETPRAHAYRVTLCEMEGTADNHTLTPAALGPPDGTFFSLGEGNRIVFDMRSGYKIVNGEGVDFIVQEGDDGAAEGFAVEGSTTWDSGWTTIGSGTGTTAFDLDSSGLDLVHFLRIIDDGDGSSSGDFPGFDIDAIEGLNVCVDGDGDGFASESCGGLDCDDSDPAVNPEADEACDGADNDCDGIIDDADQDADGYIDQDCGGDDCDDATPLSYPGAAEVCDGADNDCDGSIPADEADEDDDGYRVCADDCDDLNPDVNPGADEIRRNDIDDDCDGRIDEFELCFTAVVLGFYFP
ncbi:M14 family zinc carboxypeptidase [Thermodesulfobacteriota bacterium]